MSGLEERANQYIEHSQDLQPVAGEFYEGVMGLAYFLTPDEYLLVEADAWAEMSEKARNLFKVTFLALCDVGIELLDENTCPMPRIEFQTMAFNVAAVAATSLDVIEANTPAPKLCACN